MRKQQPGMPPYPVRHPSSKEMQLWQQQLVCKQIQELQRQQQLDQGARQQNLLSQAAARQVVANNGPGLLNGMPIKDASGYMLPNDIAGSESKIPNSSKMFIADNTNFAQGRGSPGALGSNMLTNGYGQAIHPMGFTPQQFGQSLYGTPVSSSRGLLNQYPQLQGMPSNFTDVMAEAVRTQLEKAPMHSTPSNSFRAKSLSMNSTVQGLCGGVASGNFQQVNHPQNSIQAQEFSLRHEEGGWSSNFEEKTATQVGPSRNETSLDPEEEKILFGTDDDGNLGASLGTMVGTGGPHGDPYDGNDQFDAFPSLQSGSWSALMQEAVQASSSGEGFREEWSGLSFQKTDTSTVNTSIHNDVVKHQATWDNSNNFQSASCVNLRPSPFLNDANSGSPFPTAPTFLHSNRTTCEENNRAQTDDSHESLQQTSVGEQNLQFNLSHRKRQFLEDGLESQIQLNDVPHGVWSKQMYEQSVKSSDSAGMGFVVQNNQGTWIYQGNVPLININRQPDTSRIGRTKASEGPDDNRTLFAQKSDSSSGITPVKSDIGSSQIQSVPFSRSNFAAITNSNNLHANQGMNQHLSNGHQIDLAKHVAYDSFVKSRGENVEEYINPPSKGQQVQNSSVNSVDPSPSVSDSQTSSGPSGWKTMGSRRFQSHLSENLGMNAESADSQKDTAYSQNLPKSVIHHFKNREQDCADNSQFSGHGVSDAAKGYTTGMQININSPEESQYRSTVPMQKSRNMLELLHRDNSRDSNVACIGKSDINSVRDVDDLGASDGSGLHHPHPPSASQVFGLRLASPSHQRQLSNHHSQLQTSLLSIRQVESDTEDKDRMQSASTGSDHSLHHAHEASSRENLEVRSDFYGQKHMDVPQYIPQSNFSAVPASNLPHMGHQLQMWKQKQLLQQQERISNLIAGREVMRSQSDVQESNNHASFLSQAQVCHNVSLASQSAQISLPSMARRTLPFRLDSSSDVRGPVSRFNSRNAGHFEQSNAGFYLLRTQAQQFPSVETGPVVQASARSGVSQQTGFSTMLHNVWANGPAQQVVSGHQTNDQVNTGGRIPSELGTSHNSQQFADDADKNPAEGKSLHGTGSEGGDDTFTSDNASQEQGQLSKHHSDRNLGNVPHLNVSGGTQWHNDMASNSVVGLHGHTVLQSQVQNPNYSLLQQMQVMKSADSDASKRDEKRLKVELGASSNSSFPSDVKMLSFSLEENKERSPERTFQFVGREGSSQDICSSGQPDRQNQSQPLASTSDFIGRNEHQMLTPQMSRSWLEQYRKYKNGQIVAMLADQKSTKASNESSPPLQLGGTGHDFIIRSKKRKTATSELLTWHRVVSFGAQRLQSISMSEQDWAQATNRLLEKVEDAAELIEDGSLMPRTRRRLILTTQLMQQLLPPIPASILSAEVTSSYESVAYLLAKSALGDACSLAFRPGSDSGVHLNNENGTSEKANEVFFSEVVENFIGTSRKLETDFVRLDKRTSILDIRLEWQEVERFSLINRLGRYHARGQADAAESSSTSQNASRKICPQRHVTAFSMIGNVPEGVHCLSL